MMRVISTNVKYLILLGLCGFFWTSCNVINPVESTPVYIHIDSFNFKDNPGMNISPVTLSHGINSVWAYYNGVLIGEFDLPCTFPVITNGTNTGRLQLYPGIAVDGRNSTMDIYPFYMPDTTYLVPSKSTSVINYTPTTTFYQYAKPVFKIEFNALSPHNMGNYSGTVPLIVVGDDSLVFEGSAAGSIYLASPSDSSIDSTTTFNVKYGSAAFVEFNYKSDIPFSVGMQSNLSFNISSTPYFLAGIQPSSVWRKFYLNVKAFALNYQGNNYNFFIKAVLPEGQSKGRVLIDNIQVVTF